MRVWRRALSTKGDGPTMLVQLVLLLLLLWLLLVVLLLPGQQGFCC